MTTEETRTELLEALAELGRGIRIGGSARRCRTSRWRRGARMRGGLGS